MLTGAKRQMCRQYHCRKAIQKLYTYCCHLVWNTLRYHIIPECVVSLSYILAALRMANDNRIQIKIETNDRVMNSSGYLCYDFGYWQILVRCYLGTQSILAELYLWNVWLLSEENKGKWSVIAPNGKPSSQEISNLTRPWHFWHD